MNRNSGMFAGLLVVLTILGVSTRSGRSPEGPAAASEKSAGRGSPTRNAVSEGPYSPCEEIAKRVRRFVDPMPPIGQWRLPDSCYAGGSAPKGAGRPYTRPAVRFAILTAPDPIATHLPLMFDRIVEAAQQAAQDDNYSYDSSWFPWETREAMFTRLADQQAAATLDEIQRGQPGILTFRLALHKSDDPYSGGLVVFVVGEQPTGGLRDEQFDNALAWIDALGGRAEDRDLRILGPTFSGSLPSLKRDLEPHLGGLAGKVFASSGAVSSDNGPKWFDDWLKAQRPGSFFITAMETDSVIVNRFCQYLTDQFYAAERIAFLSEDETAFGRVGSSEQRENQRNPCGQAINLYYPRDIATLRSAYERQSVLNAAGAAASGNAPSTTLRGDLSEPENNSHDTVRNYGAQLTPLSQETVLLNIIGRLKDKRIEFIILRSTNSLDQIFLSEFLRRSYPEGRVVIDGADLMFTRGAQGQTLRGVMVLSPFPLFTAQTDWTPSLLNDNLGGYRTFGEDTAEGVYIAARELFLNPRLGTEIPIHDYAPPAWTLPDDSDDAKRPATWVTVISRRRFWPLAALNARTTQNRNIAVRGLVPTSDQRGYGRQWDGDASPLRLPITMWMFLAAFAAWTSIHFYLCRSASIIGSPQGRVYFDPIDRKQHPALIALGSWLIGILAACVGTDSGLLSWQWGLTRYGNWMDTVGISVIVVGAVGMAGTACALNYGLKPLCGAHEIGNDTRSWRLKVSAATGIGMAVFIGLQCVLVYFLTPANSIPAYWRSVNLFSGVSPLLPELLLAAGGYLWFWYSLRGLAHFGDDRPMLPSASDLPQKDGTCRMPMFSREKAGDEVEIAALPLTKRYVRRAGWLLLGTAAIAALPLRGPWLRTLGELAYGIFIFGWICVYIALVLADAVQIWRAWTALRELLVYLDRLPLRRTLRALKGMAWGSIWKMSGRVLEERYRVISMQIECLRHLDNLLRDGVEPDREELKKTLAACLKRVDRFAAWYVSLHKSERLHDLCEMRDLQADLARAAAHALKDLLLGAWRAEKESLIFSRPADDTNAESKKDEDETAEPSFPAGVPPEVRAAEELFVLPYLGFIQNVLGRIRTMALGSLWLFVGATLAVSSYPFDPLNILGGIFLAVFAIVGSVTILVYSQMCRDSTLSHITNTKPGQLGSEFWMRLLGFGFGPLAGLLTTLFPSITDFAFAWLQPSVEALK